MVKNKAWKQKGKNTGEETEEERERNKEKETTAKTGTWQQKTEGRRNQPDKEERTGHRIKWKGKKNNETGTEQMQKEKKRTRQEEWKKEEGRHM